MLATMGPNIVFAHLPVILTCGIVTALLGFILIKIEFHSHPLSVGSHAKKGIGYPMRVLISIVPSYTTEKSFIIKMFGIGHCNRSHSRIFSRKLSPAIARGLRSDVRAAAGCLTPSERVQSRLKSPPSSLPTSPVPRPSPQGTPEALSSPILRRLSSTSQSARRR